METSPTPGIISFGIMILPPSFSTFSSTLSMFSTFTKFLMVSFPCRLYNPPIFIVPPSAFPVMIS